MGSRPSLRSSLIEPLTARELEILRYMADGGGFRDIARRLHLAPTTVKWYSQQIYSKLGIDHAGQKRRHAIAQARVLGLLEPSRTATGRSRYSLPISTTPFVGRSQELDELSALLADPAIRLATLFGPGGIGKTRLAVEFAWRLVEPIAFDTEPAGFPHGVYFVPLQAHHSAEQVLWAIANAVEYTFQASSRSPREELFEFFAEKRLLLVMDNFEHVLDTASIIGDLLQAADSVQVLATSREVLGLSAETVYPVGGLPYIPDHAGAQPDAARLFIQCAKQALPSFNLEPEDELSLRRICQQVGGMPLAIRLAASWVTTLSLQEIAEDILCCPEFLAAEMPDVPPRQWSIRALFEPTWTRLSAKERAAFMRLAVFQSGGKREAIQTVTGASLPVLQALVKKAVLSRDPDGRYRVHEMLRQFAEEHLIDAGEADAARDAHAAYYADFMARRTDELKGGERQLIALAEIEADFENVQRAWEWVTDHHQIDDLMRMEWAFSWYLYIRGRSVEGHTLYKHTLDRVDDRALCGRLMARIGRFCEQLGRRREGLEWTRKSVAIAREQDDLAVLAFALRQLGVFSAGAARDFDDAHRILDESLAIWAALEDGWGEALGWLGKAVAFRWADNTPAALAFTEKGLVHVERAGDRFMSAMGYLNAGVDCMQLGDQQKAVWHFEESLARYSALNAPSGMALAHGNLGVAYEHVGDYDAAMQQYEEALALAREYSHRESIVGNLLNITEIYAITGRFDRARELLAAARTMMPSIEIDRLITWGLLAEARISFRQKDYEAARQSAHAAFDSSQAVNRQKSASRSAFVKASHTATQSLLWMALIEIRLGQLDAARQHLRASLPSLAYPRHTVMAVYTLAELNAAQRHWRRAAEYAAAVEHCAVARHEIRGWAGDLLAEFRRSLTPEDFAAAVTRGAALDLADVVTDFLQGQPRNPTRD